MAAPKRKDEKKRILKEGEYQRENGTYEFKWRDANGKRHSRYAKTLEELREKEADILRDTLEGINFSNSSMTLDDIYERWIGLKRGLKEVTLNKYKHDYSKYIKPSLGGYKISNLKASDIRAFYNNLYEIRRFTVGTIGTIHRILNQILEFAVDDDLIRKNPAKKALKEFTAGTHKEAVTRKAMTVAEQDLFENFLETSQKFNRWQPLFTVMLWTGLRAGELTALRWDDIDFENDIIKVNHNLVYVGDEQFKNNRAVITTPKTQNGIRTIPMIPKVKAALLREKKIQELFGEKCTEVIDGYTNFVFISRGGGPKHVWGLNDALTNIVAACNREVMARWDEESSDNGDMPVTLPDLSSHWMRHTFATRCCEARMDPKAIQSILGHADYETTMNIYVEATSDLKKNEILFLDKFMKEHSSDNHSNSNSSKVANKSNTNPDPQS